MGKTASINCDQKDGLVEFSQFKTWSLGGIVFILLFIFLVGVKTLGNSFELLGGGFAEGLFSLGTSPFLALMMGMLATVIIQSSSATTSIIVGLVSGGAISLGGAIPMIMGANLGTSVTNSLVSLGYLKNREHFQKAFAAATIHDIFNIFAVMILLPLELATGILEKMARATASVLYGTTSSWNFSSPIKAAIKPFTNGIEWAALELGGPIFGGALMLGFSALLIILALSFIVKNTKKIVERKQSAILDRLLRKNHYISLAFGIVLTFLVQSSSITTSLLIPMAGSGLLSLRAVFPITVGANIGTTATALIAALTGNVFGLAIAFVHFYFNLLGTLILYVPTPTRALSLKVAEKLADISGRRRLVGVGYIFAFFFILPLSLALIF